MQAIRGENSGRFQYRDPVARMQQKSPIRDRVRLCIGLISLLYQVTSPQYEPQ
jgi:hypothetical protein